MTKHLIIGAKQRKALEFITKQARCDLPNEFEQVGHVV